ARLRLTADKRRPVQTAARPARARPGPQRCELYVPPLTRARELPAPTMNARPPQGAARPTPAASLSRRTDHGRNRRTPVCTRLPFHPFAAARRRLRAVPRRPAERHRLLPQLRDPVAELRLLADRRRPGGGRFRHGLRADGARALAPFAQRGGARRGPV